MTFHPPNPPPAPGTWPGAVPGWYPDPWRIATWRWWDGYRWSPYLHGPYIHDPDVRGPYGPPPTWAAAKKPFVAKGPGIQGGGIAAVGIGVGVLGTVFVAIGFGLSSSTPFDVRDPWYVLSSQLALWVGFVGAPIMASRRNGSGSLARDYRLAWPRAKDWLAGVAGGLVGRVPATLVLVLIVLAGNGFGASNGAAPQIDGMTPEGTAGWVVAAMLGIVGAPIVEELLFRGLIQGAFTRRVGPVAAIFVTALIFSAAHITNEGFFAPIVLFPPALVLGYLRYRSGSLAPGMVAHATFNALGFALLLVPAFR